MKESVTTITQRSQVTIPAEVRRVLGVKPRDKVAFTIGDGGVRLESAPFSLESAYGSVKPAEIPEDFDKISREVKDAKAEKTALDLYATSPFLDFEDAVAVAHMEQRDILEIVSYDKDFDRIAGIRRAEPK